jgi:hypothetical protein
MYARQMFVKFYLRLHAKNVSLFACALFFSCSHVCVHLFVHATVSSGACSAVFTCVQAPQVMLSVLGNGFAKYILVM